MQGGGNGLCCGEYRLQGEERKVERERQSEGGEGKGSWKERENTTESDRRERGFAYPYSDRSPIWTGGSRPE